MGTPVVTAIRAPTPDLANHQVVLTQLKEETELGRRIRGLPENSFVTLGELISAGLVKFISGVVSPGNKIGGGGGLSTVNVTDSIVGDGSIGTPLKLDGDSASPGNTKLYGTNGSGVKGWYTQPAGGSSLSVTDGTHTVTGTTSLTFSGGTVSGSTPNATVTISGGGSTFSGVSVRQSTNQSLPGSALTVLNFDTSVYDVSGYHSVVTNNSRLTAPTTGYYLVTAVVREGGTTVTDYLVLGFNGSTTNAPTVSTGDFAGGMSIAWEGHFTAGDYVELYVFAASGNSTDATATTFTMSARANATIPIDYNVTPDTHPAGVPAFVENDEFEGVSLDTAGTRFTGATAWTWLQQNTATATLGMGSLTMTGQAVATNTINAIIQPLAGSAWKFRAKASFFNPASNNYGAALTLYESGSGKMSSIGVFFNGGSVNLIVAEGTLGTGWTAVPYNNPISGIFPNMTVNGVASPWAYFEIELASGTLFYRVSNTGLDGSFVLLVSITVASEFTVAPDNVGISVRADNTTTCIMFVDWFRRMA